MMKPYVGALVHYIMEEGRYIGQCRPAIILRVWDSEQTNGCCQLVVLQDGTNDTPDKPQIGLWKTSRLYSEYGEIKPPLFVNHATWHEIEECDN